MPPCSKIGSAWPLRKCWPGSFRGHASSRFDLTLLEYNKRGKKENSLSLFSNPATRFIPPGATVPGGFAADRTASLEMRMPFSQNVLTLLNSWPLPVPLLERFAKGV